MNIKFLLLFLPLALIAREIVWDSKLYDETDKKTVDRAVMEYVEYKYPKKVQAYEQREINRANASEHTLKLNGIMYQDNVAAELILKNHKDAKEYCSRLDLTG